MVTRDIRKRKNCEFSLVRVRELSEKQFVHYGSNDVELDILDLEYKKSDVCECLESLSEENYHESVNYNDHKGWLDVYKVHWPSKNGYFDHKLYIKLKLNKDCLVIVLASFHESTSK